MYMSVHIIIFAHSCTYYIGSPCLQERNLTFKLIDFPFSYIFSPKEHHLPDKIIYYIEKLNLAIHSQLTDVNWRHVPVLIWSFQVLVSLCHDLKTSIWREIGKNFPEYHF